VLAALLGEEIAIEFVIPVGEEHRLAPISTLRHMVGRPGTTKRAMRAKGALDREDFAADNGMVLGVE
jgi:hypothetical protein